MIRPTFLAAACLAFLLTACGEPSKGEMIEKAEGADTKSALETALGKPDDVSKLGPIERWTYNASDGQVIFIITGETVALEMAGGGSTQ